MVTNQLSMTDNSIINCQGKGITVIIQLEHQLNTLIFIATLLDAAQHYVRRPSSLACYTELQAKTELNQQHFGWEDPWH